MGNEQDLSPIEQIRLAEAEVARRLAAASEAAEKSLLTTQEQAAQIREEACQAGRQEGEQRYGELIAESKAQADAIVAHAQEQAGALRQVSSMRLGVIVRQAVQYVLGTAGGSEQKNEH